MPIDANIMHSVLQWWDESGVDVPVIKRAAARKSGLNKAPLNTAPLNKPPLNKTSLNKMPLKAAPSGQKAVPKAESDKAATEATAQLIASAQHIASAAPTLEALFNAIDSFETGDLFASAQGSVRARGAEDAKLMIFGDAPSAQDEQAKTAFSDANGALLDKMLSAINVDESACYMAHICPWRPLSARGASPDEMALGLAFSQRLISLLQPDIIIALGGKSLNALTGKSGITKLRGQWQSAEFSGKGVSIMPIYHPSFLIKKPEFKRDAWHDLLVIKDKLSS